MNLNFSLIAQAITFALFIWFTVKLIWPYMLRAIETRQKTIGDGLAAAERGHRELEASSKRADEAIAEARGRAADILAQTEKRGVQLIEEAKGTAKNEGNRKWSPQRPRSSRNSRAPGNSCATRSRRSRSPVRRKSCSAKSTPRRTRICSNRSGGSCDDRRATQACENAPQHLTMAEPSTIARPYAEAVFRLADGAGKLAEWSTTLAMLEQVADNERVRTGMADPNLSSAKVAGLFISILAGKLSGDAENFVRVMAENRRLELLGDVRAQYEALKNAREGVIEADVQSAFELTDAQLAELVSALEKRTGRKVKAQVRLDKSLIGGVRIVMGDKVIDGSARAQLGALESALKA